MVERQQYNEAWPEEIKGKLESEFQSKIKVSKTAVRRIWADVDCESIYDVCMYLRDELNFEHCATVIGVDYVDHMDVVYHIDNYTNYCGVVVELNVHLPADNLHVRSVATLWGGANWHERETYELFGIIFDGHPNLKRLLTPETYEFFPFRKSYKLRGQQ